MMIGKYYQECSLENKNADRTVGVFGMVIIR